jgi:8-oxo-dGTP diphosphatase
MTVFLNHPYDLCQDKGKAEMGKEEQGLAASSRRYTVVPRTLCFILSPEGGEVLLLKGAPTKRIWPNKYNGIGGHVESGEDVYTAAVREVREETGLAVRDVRLRGVINIPVEDRQGIVVFVFRARAESRQVTPSEEGMLEWVPREQLRALPLVEDLPALIPRVLDSPWGAPLFFGLYTYDETDQLLIQWAGSET